MRGHGVAGGTLAGRGGVVDAGGASDDAAGRFRVEGKGYEVKGGDVLHFLFNT